MKLFVALLLCSCQITSYRSVKEQTDDTPFITANGGYVHSSGVAVSRDLHYNYGGPIRYGDIVFIEDYGFKVVNDLMADFVCLDSPSPQYKKDCVKKKYQRKSLDIWVKTFNEEKSIGVKTKKVWLVR